MSSLISIKNLTEKLKGKNNNQMKRKTVLDTEKKIGIQVFFTPHPGINGKLRTLAEDFVVNELSCYPSEKEKGNFTIADISSVNWETNLLIRELSDRLHISRKRISFAGTKDKRAKTSQMISLYKVSKDDLSKIFIKDVSITNSYYSDRPVKLGDLTGNNFEITIRNIDGEDEDIKKIQSSIIKKGGFPNFYGIQRFGITRPVTHIVGKHIVKGSFEDAVFSYIANPMKTESEESYKVRNTLEKDRDYAKALRSYPFYLNYEISILNKLVQDPTDFISALKELPNNLLTMFIYAYQSYLYNKMLSERIIREIPIDKAVPGDIVLPIRKGNIENQEIKVKDSNIEKINNQISKGNAVVSGLLIGSDSTFADGEMGEIEHRIVEKEKIDYRDFIIPEIPFISSKGSRRGLISKVQKIEYKIIKDTINKNSLAVILKFKLDKGSYATSLLREFMKSEDIRNY